jgi:TP901 family phage tail tape measure protein
MWDKLPEYSANATSLGTSIRDLYGATTLYYQQGLQSNAAMSVGIETMKMARIANLDAADATKAMTAALRGFNMEVNEVNAQRINDVYSELAAITAADTGQIADAMTKTASIAHSANMEFETTAALLAQIIETTQEAPETAGTAMKTIIARFTEVKQLFSEGMLTGEDSEGEVVDINKIDAALRTVDISLKDFLNGSKGIDDIFLELAEKWDTLDLATQRYIATAAAGSRQQSRFIAMMSNYERTMELVTAANNSAGAS